MKLNKAVSTGEDGVLGVDLFQQLEGLLFDAVEHNDDVGADGRVFEEGERVRAEGPSAQHHTV